MNAGTDADVTGMRPCSGAKASAGGNGNATTPPQRAGLSLIQRAGPAAYSALGRAWWYLDPRAAPPPTERRPHSGANIAPRNEVLGRGWRHRSDAAPGPD